MVMPIVLMLVFALVAIAIAIAARRRSIEKVKLLAANLATVGWTFDQTPTPEAKADAWNAIARPTLNRDHKSIQWIARGTASGAPVVAFEHRVVVSTGKSTTVITHTLAGIAGLHGLPHLTLARRHWWHRLGQLFGKRPASIDDGGPFDRAFVVFTSDHAAARAILTPGVRAWAHEWLRPRMASLLMSSDGLTVWRRASLAPPDIEDLTRQPGRVLAAISEAGKEA